MIALLRDADRTWMNQAACRNHNADLWYPTAGRQAPAQAIAICTGCPVREQCAAYADSHGEQHGVWGGMTTEQRQRRARRKAVAS